MFEELPELHDLISSCLVSDIEEEERQLHLEKAKAEGLEKRLEEEIEKERLLEEKEKKMELMLAAKTEEAETATIEGLRELADLSSELAKKLYTYLVLFFYFLHA